MNENQFSDTSFDDCVESYGLKQLIDEPTRITATSQTLLDVICSSKPELVLDSGVIDHYLSDQRGFFCKINLIKKLKSPKLVVYRDFRSFSHQDFMADLSNVSFDDILYVEDIGSKVSIFCGYSTNIFDKRAPYVESRISKKFSPWITPTIKRMMKDRDRALSRYKRTKNLADHNYYARLRNTVTSAVRREKYAFMSHARREGLEFFGGLSSRSMW